MDKIRIPKKVADAIEDANCWNIDLIGINARNTPESSYGIIFDWMRDRGREGVRDYFDVMVNGYVISRTPHELVAELYEITQRPRRYRKEYVLFDRGVRYGIEKTLRVLGITVEGINDKEVE